MVEPGRRFVQLAAVTGAARAGLSLRRLGGIARGRGGSRLRDLVPVVGPGTQAGRGVSEMNARRHRRDGVEPTRSPLVWFANDRPELTRLRHRRRAAAGSAGASSRSGALARRRHLPGALARLQRSRHRRACRRPSRYRRSGRRDPCHHDRRPQPRGGRRVQRPQRCGPAGDRTRRSRPSTPPRGWWPRCSCSSPRYPLVTADHGARYHAKLRAFPAFVEAWCERLRAAAAAGVVPIRHLVERQLRLLDDVLAVPLSAGPLAAQRPPTDLDEADAEAWSETLRALLDTDVAPGARGPARHHRRSHVAGCPARRPTRTRAPRRRCGGVPPTDCGRSPASS